MTTHAPVHPLPPSPQPSANPLPQAEEARPEARALRPLARSVAGPSSAGGPGVGDGLVAHGLLATFTARPFLITLALGALWVALSAVLALVAQQVFGMDAPAAWAYAIGIVSYMYLFTGFVVGLIYLVRRDSEHVDGA